MSFSATFYFDGGPAEGQEIVRLKHGFLQGLDDKKRPNTTVRSSMVGVTLVMTSDNGLASWMLNPYERRNARIVYKRTDQDSIFTETIFKEAYCIFYQDKLNARGGKNASATVDIYLSPKKITIRGIDFDSGWEA